MRTMIVSIPFTNMRNFSEGRNNNNSSRIIRNNNRINQIVLIILLLVFNMKARNAIRNL